jgi:hypothetical protein
VEVVVVPEGVAVRLQRKDRKSVRRIAFTSGEKFLRINPVVSAPGVVLTGVKPGVARLTLTDGDGKEEKVIVAVEKEEK